MDAYEVNEKEIDYNKVIAEFGASLITDELARKINHPLVPSLFFAHRDLDKIIDQEFAIVSGRGPSRYMHLGHLLLFSFVRDLQKKFKAFTFIPFSDDEKLLARNIGYEQVLLMDYENLLDLLALGFDLKKTEFMFDLVNMKQEVYNLAIKISSKLTLSTVKSALGFEPSQSIGIHFYPAIQAAHILYPTASFDLPVLVPIGIDQDVFVKLTRDVASSLGLKKPSDIMSKFLPGLTGGKMSSSKPETAIYTTDSYEEVKRKIWNAFTGGRATAKEQREKGGNPEVCVVNKYLKIFFGIDNSEACRRGEILCGECKKMLVEKLWEMLSKHQKEREKAKKKAEQAAPELVEIVEKIRK